MRRGLGVGAVQRGRQMNQQFKKVGAEMAEENMKQMRESLAVFQKSLEDFAEKHAKQIKKDPQFRQYFNEMCQKIGIDPLASKRGFWSQLLGVGDFYYELGVQIVEVCLRTRSSNGGLIDIDELRQKLIKLRGPKAQEVSNDDIERSIKTIKQLGNGFNVIVVGSKKIVQSVPCELNNDHTTAMVFAQEKGFITASVLRQELSWDDTRIDGVMNLLLQQGMVWADDQTENGERAFWFPSLINISLDADDEELDDL